MGSSVMRVQQLSAHIKRHNGDRYDVRCVPIASSRKLWVRAWLALQPKGCVYFFSKDALRGWRAEDLDALRRKAAAVLVDYVDLALRYTVAYGVDAHVMTSFAAADAMARLQAGRRARGDTTGGTIHTILHNYDSLIDDIPLDQDDDLSIGFIGTPTAAATTPAINDRITFLPASSRAEFLENAPRIGRFNCHYCVRVDTPGGLDRSYPPFTKGVTAAACDAVILTNRGCDDAATLLGEDYPYLFPSTGARDLTERMRFVEDSYRGPAWTEARERVRHLRSRTTHAAIAGQLHETIEAVAR